jgi:RNA polymerase sigma-70 factor (ECF subfamily)
MDRDRLTALYLRYGPVIYARCRLLLRDESEAEDATQETFLRIHRHLDRVPAEREALFWIYRVATNYCLNELRDRRSRPQPGNDLPEPREDADLTETRLQDRDHVRRLVERARPKLRAVAWLRHADGFDQQEIATILNLSRRTVASRLAEFVSNARKFLRRSAA